VWEALQAAYALEQTGIRTRVVNLHTIKPLDMNLVTDCAARFPLIVTAEEHQITGGLGGAVAEVMAESPHTSRLIRIGIRDRFGESGPPEALMIRYNLTAAHLIETVRNNLTHA
jgi:transketolase